MTVSILLISTNAALALVATAVLRKRWMKAIAWGAFSIEIVCLAYLLFLWSQQ